jgi:F-type H+-transporting ATPase subunit delta
MSNSRAANRYAKAILSIAEEQNNLDLISRDFEFIDEMTKEVKEFVLFLRNPIISSEKKKRILREILQSKISDTMMRFILLLVSKIGKEFFLKLLIIFIVCVMKSLGY